MENQPQTRDEIMAELNRLNALIETKRQGRRAMEESGMTVEPESEDMDMQDLLAQMAELNDRLAMLNSQEQGQRESDVRQTEIRDL